MLTKLVNWVRQESDLLLNGGSIIGTTALTSGLGFLFWLLAARSSTPADVGLASAAVSAMQLLGTIGVMGLGTLLIRELPRQNGEKGSLIMAALLIASGLSLLLGALFAVLAPVASDEFLPLRSGLGSVVLFALGVALTAATVVFDRACIGLLRGGLQLERNGFFGIAKLVALLAAGVWIPTAGGLAIYGVWALANLLSLLFVAGRVGVARVAKSAVSPQWQLLTHLRGDALRHHALNLSIYAPDWFFPVLTTALFSSETTAYYYVASMLAAFVGTAPHALTQALYAIGAQNPDLLARKMRLTLKLSTLIGIVANLVLVFAADFILSWYGTTYVAPAAACLRILALGVFPTTVTTHYLTISRIHRRFLSATKAIAAVGALGLALGAMGAKLYGLSGLAAGWVIAQAIGAVFMAPSVYREAFPGSRGSRDAAAQNQTDSHVRDHGPA